MLHILLFIIGLLLALAGAETLIGGATSLGKRLRVSELVIGLTVVAFGTSLPELVVDLIASWQGHNAIAIGNISGSNIFNILLILGVTAVIYPIRVETQLVWKGIPLALLSGLVFIVCVNDQFFDHRSFNELSRIDGILFLAFFLIFLYYSFGTSRPAKSDKHLNLKLSTLQASALIAAGLAGLILGGHLLVKGATELALAFGLSKHLVGTLIIAPGTSMPELLSSIAAARRGNTDMAVGNIVGSNIFNVFFILGVSSVLHTIPFNTSSNFDLGVNILASLLIFIFAFTGTRHRIDRWEGGLFIALFVLFISYLLYQA